jgi:hypothetical protein
MFLKSTIVQTRCKNFKRVKKKDIYKKIEHSCEKRNSERIVERDGRSKRKLVM